MYGLIEQVRKELIVIIYILLNLRFIDAMGK